MEQKQFWQAKETCDTRAMADYLVEAYRGLLALKAPFEASPLASLDVLLYEGLRAILDDAPVRAGQYLAAYQKIGMTCHCLIWVDQLKCAGIAAYQQGDFEAACRFFEQHRSYESDPEVSVWYGNALMCLGRVQEARPCYLEAMAAGIPDVLPAADVAARNLLQTLASDLHTGNEAADAVLASAAFTDGPEDVPAHTVPEASLSEAFDFPVFINCRDRLDCLQKLVGWLLAAGHRKIYLIDNASTYPPLLAYYQEITKDPRVTLIQLSQNFGHQALWRTGLLRQLDVRTPYVYTDPDVLPIEDCPKGLVPRLYQILRRYPFVNKVGTGIQRNDLPPFARAYAKVPYYNVPIEEGLYFAACDTTFALYPPVVQHYTISFALLTQGRLLVRHLPWYLDPHHLPEDEAYYIAHADQSSTFARDVNAADES